MKLLPLPIDAVLPELLAAVRQHRAAVLLAETGAGKTTRVPPALLDAGLAGDGAVLVLQPRRLAARAAAARMAHERGVRLGDEVGYRVRFDACAGRATRLEVVTEGLFVRRLQEDPFLQGVGAVVFDEFHERHVDGDLAFAMVGRLRAELRPELPLLVMSATLQAGPVAAALGGAPVVVCPGRSFPVDVRYLPPGLAGERLEHLVLTGVRAALQQSPGDVLVFLPGVGEIRRCAEALADIAREHGLRLQRLYGDLPAAEQDAVLAGGGGRRLVLATNVAETSVTIPGVTAVVDSGLARSLRFDPDIGLDRLELRPIAQASADQRAGRAGRTAPGLCVRLWSEAGHRNRPAQETPELQRVDLAGPLLQLLAWGEAEPRALPWLEPPPAPAVAEGLLLLERLGARAAGGALTPVGQELARLPVPPRVGCLLLAGRRLGLLRQACLAAALLSERDPFRRARGDVPPPSRSDLLDRVERLSGGRRVGAGPEGGGRRGGVEAVLQAAEQLQRLLSERAPARQDAPRSAQPVARDEAFLRMALEAFPDRVARRREPGSPRALMVGGRGVILQPESAVRQAELFLCLQLDAGGGHDETRVLLASAVEREWLPASRVRTGTELGFDATRQQVEARRRVRYDDLVLEETPAALPSSAEVAEVLAAAASQALEAALPLEAPEVAGYRARVLCLRQWMPELQLPAFDEAALRALLPELCARRRSFAELRRAPLLAAFAGRLTHSQRRALDEQAPERIAVPSGSQHTLRYEAGRPPVLAVRLQELFGCATTPRVAGGRVPVLLHLLAPNQRVQQITDDLAGFWARTYPTVRKELRARYPRHAWPEDPLAAAPQRRPKRRGT